MSKKHPNGTVYVYNKTRETFVATAATVADSYFRRLVGLLGKTKQWARFGSGLWIVPSRGVHTVGMLFPIDLIFLGKEKVVVHLEEHVRPFRISKVSLKAASVLELPRTRSIARGPRWETSWRFRARAFRRRATVQPTMLRPEVVFTRAQA